MWARPNANEVAEIIEDFVDFLQLFYIPCRVRPYVLFHTHLLHHKSYWTKCKASSLLLVCDVYHWITLGASDT
jgi:hypothetical protein